MKYDWKLYLCDDQGKKFFGLGPMTLLLKVDEYGSLKKAAEDMSLSYHKALNMIKAAEAGFGCPLMVKKIGGERGGGSTLTPAAQEIIQTYRTFEARLDQCADQIFSELFKSET